MTTVRPFRFIGHSDVEHLQQGLVAVLNSWASDWLGRDQGLIMAEARNAPRPADRGEGDRWEKMVTTTNGRWCAIVCESEFQRRLGAALLQDQKGEMRKKTSVISDALTSSALMDLARRVLGVNAEQGDGDCAMENGAAPPDAYSSGSGAITVFVDIQTNIFISLTLPFSIVERYLGTENRVRKENDEELVAAKIAIEDLPVKAKARLGIAQITLGELASLEVGDVIKMEQRIDHPTIIGFTGSAVELKGYLGKQDGCIALKVVPSENPTSEQHEQLKVS